MDIYIYCRYMKILLSMPDTLLKKIDDYCAKHDYERSEFVRKVMRDVLEAGMPPVQVVNKDAIPAMKTKDVKELINAYIPISERMVRGIAEIPGTHIPHEVTITLPEPEHLWDDHNLMPVYKTGIDNQYCPTWCKKGVLQRTYPIKKFDIDNKLLWELQLCKDCIKKELSTCKSLGGHLE